MSKFSRWFNSKTGKRTVAGILALALVVAIVGQLVNWWDLFPGAGTVIVIPPTEPYPAPVNGYTCLPTCAENDGKFFVAPGQDQKTFAGAKTALWIAVPGDYTTFEVGIFDGDDGKDNNGNLNISGGNWDQSTEETTYTLYADPLKNGQGMTVVGQWRGNQDPMPNNAWYNITLNNVPEAKSPSGHYFYRLEVVREVQRYGSNFYKIRSTGYMSTGKSGLVNASFGISGGYANVNDLRILYPNGYSAASTYTGDWRFYLYIPNGSTTLEFWDGDFDRGTSDTVEADTDDPNTEGIPTWADPLVTIPEGVGGVLGKGDPADNNSNRILRRSPAVRYELIDPAGSPLYTNTEPSGTEEWEYFMISTDPTKNPDLLVTEIKPGFYTVHIEGLDLHNFVWFHANYDICDPEDGCGPTPWPEGNCPRTIGYWKNNVSKVIAGRTNGVQESQETLEWALKNVALASPLYRSGLNSSLMNPEPIANAVPLTLQDAEVILQRTVSKKSTYPGDPQSMMARALQQNLASWLNLGSGKVGPTTVVRLDVAGGVFEGTLMDALLEAQTIILNATSPNDPLLERAKDIGDQINNGFLGEEAADSVCEDYVQVIPPDKQPPKHKDMPKAPVPPEPPMPTPEPPVCTIPDLHLAGDYAIVALNPADCQGQQNGLLFHGTSLTQIDGTAYSNGCVRAVGTTDVQVSAPVDYVVDQFGDMSLISAGVRQIPALDPATWTVNPPNCSDPAAIQMNGEDFKGNVALNPGLYCISGDVTINNHESLSGEGVTLYFTDGRLMINGGATVQLSAPSTGASPALPGILIYFPQTNSNPLMITGNSDSYFTGVIYAPASEIEVLGTSLVLGYNAQFIGWDVRVGGTSDVIIGLNSDGQNICQ